MAGYRIQYTGFLPCDNTLAGRIWAWKRLVDMEAALRAAGLEDVRHKSAREEDIAPQPSGA